MSTANNMHEAPFRSRESNVCVATHGHLGQDVEPLDEVLELRDGLVLRQVLVVLPHRRRLLPQDVAHHPEVEVPQLAVQLVPAPHREGYEKRGC